MTDIATDIIEAARGLAGQMAEVIAVDGAPAEIMLLHKDYKIENLDKFLDKPTRIRETIQVGDIESLIEYTNKFKAEGVTPLGFALPDKIGAVLDYHDGNPSWGTHVVFYAFEETLEWKDWIEKDEHQFGQLELGEFIEDHIDNIMEPQAAKLLEIVTSFQENRTANLTSAVNTQNGMVKLTFLEDAKQGEVIMPQKLKLGIAPFKHSPIYGIEAKVRYRVAGPAVKIWYRLNRPDKVKDDAIKSFRDVYAEKSGLKVLLAPKFERFAGK
jgi:uncharacterized protein YfdQ (DUF2303 family)